MIPQIKKILYATDLSRNSAYAFYYAVDLAQKKGATIVILNAIEPIPAFVKSYITEVEKLQLFICRGTLEIRRHLLRKE